VRAPKPQGWLARVLAGVVLTQAALHLARPVTSYRALALGADAGPATAGGSATS
jgi:hypothetical protein